MWKNSFDRMLRRLIRIGRLTVTYPDGEIRTYGAGTGTGPEHAIEIADAATLRALCLNPELALGESYMNGALRVAGDDLEGLVRLLLRNLRPDAFPAWVRIADRARFRLRDWVLRNTPLTARRNVAHHYDLSDTLYALFLDRDMQYCCAYFRDPGMTLDEAQAAKKAHIAAKLRIEPGMRVLDIGCGWGGMALTLARDHGARVTGVTLSENQLATARRRAERGGPGGSRRPSACRTTATSPSGSTASSRSACWNMSARRNTTTYFGQVSRLLSEDGIALIHTIGRCAPPMAHSPWIHKYIFPGGYVPALSELAGRHRDARASGTWISRSGACITR